MGEVAQLKGKLPFARGSALLTLEREGVWETYVKRLEGPDFTWEVPIKKTAYAPSVYASIFAVGGRTTPIEYGLMADPGAPKYGVGLAKLRVDEPFNGLNVVVTTAKDAYRPDQEVEATIQVSTADGSLLDPKTDAAVFVVNDSVLRLGGQPDLECFGRFADQAPLGTDLYRNERTAERTQ